AFAKANGATVVRRYSYASWTAPALYAFLMGLLPHSSPAGVIATKVYEQEFVRWNSRLGVDVLDFPRLLPQLSLPRLLRELGYSTVARVSLPVLNESTLISRYFDDYRLMDCHHDFAGMIMSNDFKQDQPNFFFYNLGETHYPYML